MGCRVNAVRERLQLVLDDFVVHPRELYIDGLDTLLKDSLAEIERLRDRIKFIRDQMPDRYQVELFDYDDGGVGVRLTMSLETYEYITEETQVEPKEGKPT